MNSPLWQKRWLGDEVVDEGAGWRPLTANDGLYLFASV